MSKALVIGSNSFSGSSFIRYLLQKEDGVVAVSRSKESNKIFLGYCEGSLYKKVEFLQVDLNKDLDLLDSLVDKYKPSSIYNFAAQSMVGQSWQHPEDWFQTNTVAFSKLIKALSHKDFIDKYLHISTPEVYGSTDGEITESSIYSPSTPYAISRATGDMIINAYQREFGFPAITTRAANVYGEHQQLYRIIPKSILSILKGVRLPLHGGGISERSFIHIDDVSNATYMLGEKGEVGGSYHISTERIVTIRELVELICSALGVDFEQAVDVCEDRVGKDQAYKLDSSKIRALGWKDQVLLEDGIERSIAWVKENFEQLSVLPMNYIHKA